MEIQVMPLRSMAEAEEIVEVQRQAWQMSDLGIVPTFETKAVSDAGFVYVAKDKGKVVGFIYGYHHFPDIHYSHMMAVLPEYQSRGVGYQLKKYHRDQAMKSKHYVRLVQWTVDPLLPNNAFLNFAKLGGYCDTYKINYYGDPESDGVEIYAGVPTDRFKLSWPIHSERVKARMKDYKQDRVDYLKLQSRSPIINSIIDMHYSGDTNIPDHNFCVEVPSDYQDIRKKDLEIARSWRTTFREICIGALELDFIIDDYHHVVNPSTAEKSNFYEFVRKDETQL